MRTLNPTILQLTETDCVAGGLDWSGRYPSIAAAVAALSCRSCLIDGEVVICGEDGIPVFDRLRYGRHCKSKGICALHWGKRLWLPKTRSERNDGVGRQGSDTQ